MRLLSGSYLQQPITIRETRQRKQDAHRLERCDRRIARSSNVHLPFAGLNGLGRQGLSCVNLQFQMRHAVRKGKASITNEKKRKYHGKADSTAEGVTVRRGSNVTDNDLQRTINNKKEEEIHNNNE